MIDFKFNKFVKGLKSVSLSNQERALLRQDFLVQTGLTAMAEQSLPKHFPIGSFFVFRSFQMTVVVCFVVVASGGFVVYSSTHSLPGDILYPLKTDVTEPVIRAFHDTSAVSAADYEVQLVNERLVEAEKLNQESPLTSDQKDIIKNQVMAQTARAENAIRGLQGVGGDKDGAIATATTTLATSTPIFIVNNAVQATTTPATERPEYKHLQEVLKNHQTIFQDLDGDSSTSVVATSSRSYSRNNTTGNNIGNNKSYRQNSGGQEGVRNTSGSRNKGKRSDD